MTISFRTEEEYFTFHDPMQAGKLIDRKTEIRFDPLTGETSRIIHDPGAPFMPPDYTEAAGKTGGQSCPFCPENVEGSTPMFPEKLVASGRMKVGEAIAFPNLFPYSKHNAVVRICNQHYVRLAEFTSSMLLDAFTAAHAYLQAVVQSDPNTTHISINWNYLPPSGGSILHPHIHVLGSEQLTRYEALNRDYAQQFMDRNGQNYYSALLETEQKLQERWVGEKGDMQWIHAFAPKGHNDFIGVLESVNCFAELKEQHWEALVDSLLCFFRYFEQAGLASFNMAVFIPVNRNPAHQVHLRLIPRITIGALGTSDMNVLNYVHGEYLSLERPEHAAKEAAKHFS